MSNIKILDKHLEHLFHAKDTFTVAKNFEGEIYRKYENRITFTNLIKCGNGF